MTLRAKKPTVPTHRRFKAIVYGKSGVGKTWFALGLPNLYFVDAEGGAREAHYKQRMIERGIVEVSPEQGASDFNVVLDEFKTLATTRHGFKSVALDSFTSLYLGKAAEAEEAMGSEFGRDKKEANKPTRQLMRWINRMDLNVLLLCHSKDKWENVTGANGKPERTSTGQTFDGYEKLEYELDLMIEALPGGGPGKPPIGVVRKSRLNEFPVGDRFLLTYEEFASRFGREHLEQDVTPIDLPSADEVAKLRRLAKAAEVTEETQSKWLHKAVAESFEEMPRDVVQKLIAFCESKLESITSDSPEVSIAV
jgi:hypothetical protein